MNVAVVENEDGVRSFRVRYNIQVKEDLSVVELADMKSNNKNLSLHRIIKMQRRRF